MEHRRENMDIEILADTPPWEWPEGTDKMLLGILCDDQRDESDRLLALRGTGRWTQPGRILQVSSPLS